MNRTTKLVSITLGVVLVGAAITEILGDERHQQLELPS